MTGQLSSGKERLFYSFSIKDHIPANHLLRDIHRCVTMSGLLDYLADFFSTIGRPSIGPELMNRLLIVGYCQGICSERRLYKGSFEPGVSRIFPLEPRRLSPRSLLVFQKNGIAVSAMVRCFDGYLTRCYVAAWTQVWSRTKALLWTPT